MKFTFLNTALLTVFLFSLATNSQNTLWQKAQSYKDTNTLSKFNLDKNKVEIFQLDLKSLQQKLSSTQSRNFQNKGEKTIIQIPQKNEKVQSFELYEASVFSPSLAAKYPNIKSFIGYSTDGLATQLRMSISPQGVQAMIVKIGHPTQFIQPTHKGSADYVLYSSNDKQNTNEVFQCGMTDPFNKSLQKTNSTAKALINEGGANDQTLRKFRIAISTTSEYTAYHDDGNDTNGDAIADALAAINTTLARVNQVYETDMAITFELVDATQLIYNNTATDPYSNGLALNQELQTNLTNTIGNAAYDIGHLFTKQETISSAGCLACVCEDDKEDGNPYKGSGFTGALDGIPEGDSYDISYVAHEIGHQMGATHTASDNPESSGTSAEPGSGSTIMGYAGITGFSDVQTQSDAYFHYHSIRQVLNTVTNFATCWESNSTFNPGDIVNNPPSANAGSNYNIPPGTAYILKGEATDTDGTGNLTYCWEQTDSAPRTIPVTGDSFGPTLARGPMNRSLPPSSSSDRYIPKFSSVIAGNTTQTNPTVGSDWETVSTVERTLNWALTVRDRSPSNPNGSQSSFDTMQIIVENTVPFTVKNPVSWAQDSNQTIKWVVGDTDNETINCKTVNIKLSTDGGLSFPISLANNTSNDGAFTFTVPNIANTSDARILIEAADNIFYDVSDFNFSINNAPSFFVNQTNNPEIDNENNCNATSLVYTFDYTVDNGFSENTVFSVSGNPSGTSVVFSPSSRSTTGTFTMTISDVDVHGLYNLVVTGTSNSITKNLPTELSVFRHCAPDGDNDPTLTTTTALVSFNTINNATGSLKTASYVSYHQISTDVNQDSTYELNVETFAEFENEVKAWIDWNQDCDFDDDGEEYNLGYREESGQPSNAPLSITIPTTAKLGATVMRIGSASYFPDTAGGPPPEEFSVEACDDAFIGGDVEFEDYTIMVQKALSVDSFEINNFSVYPNPNNGSFTLKLESISSKKVTVEIFDLRGRIIFKNKYQNKTSFKEDIKLNNAESGLYLLRVSDGIRTSTRKIIVD